MHLDLQAIAQAIGYPAAALGILIETAGIPFPGETLMLVVAAYAAQGFLDIRLVILTAAAGTIVGADLGYLVGRLGGRPFVERATRKLRLGSDHLSRAELFFARYGAAAILVARFFVGLRQWSAVLAGMARMPFWKFQLFTVLGGGLWSLGVCLAGFYLGHNLALLERAFRTVGYAGLAALAAVIALAWLLRRRGRRRSR